MGKSVAASDPGSPGTPSGKKKKNLAPPVIKPPPASGDDGPQVPGGRRGQKEANAKKAKVSYNLYDSYS